MFQLRGQSKALISLCYRRACAFLQKLPLRRCTLCDTHGLDNQNLCQPCATELPMNMSACTGCGREIINLPTNRCPACVKHPPMWQRCYATCSYEIPADYLVKRFKYAGDRAAGRAMAEQMWSQAKGFRKEMQGAIFLAVPLHKTRLIERGFNQSEFLAADLARRCDGKLIQIGVVDLTLWCFARAPAPRK